MINLRFPQFLRGNHAKIFRVVDFSLRWGLLLLFIALNTPRGSSSLQAVLGASTKHDETAEEYARLVENLSYWQDVATTYPDYKDAHLMTASLGYRIGADDIALYAASRALALDPNDQAAQELRQLLENDK